MEEKGEKEARRKGSKKIRTQGKKRELLLRGVGEGGEKNMEDNQVLKKMPTIFFAKLGGHFFRLVLIIDDDSN